MKNINPLHSDFLFLLKGKISKNEKWRKCVSVLEEERNKFVSNCLKDKIFNQNKFNGECEVSDGITGDDCKKQYKALRNNNKSKISFLVNNNKFCAYCGTTHAKTIDHILPKSQYAQLSICLENMVPCCDNCNRKKSEYFANNKEELLFNPNYDTFCSCEWIKVDSRIKDKTIFFVCCLNENDLKLKQNELIKIKNTLVQLDILESFNLALENIYKEDFLDEDIKSLIKNPSQLKKEQERITKIIMHNIKQNTMSERPFLKYCLLCHFETKEFQHNFYTIQSRVG